MDATTTTGSNTRRVRAINLGASIESVFEDIVNEKIIVVPISFWEFYNSTAVLHFLKATLLYIYAFSNVTTLKKVAVSALPLCEKEAHEIQVQNAVKTLESRTVVMSKVYSKIVLHCSNFENQKEDEHFFECLYHFTCRIVKTGLAAECWNAAEEELGIVFRSEAFNNKKVLPKEETTKEKSSLKKIGARVKKKKPLITFPPVYMYASATASSAAAQVSAVKNRVTNNLEKAAKLRRVMDERREAEARARIEERVALNVREASNIGLRSPRRPLGNNKTSVSVRAMMNARSPAIARILPTAKDRAIQSFRRRKVIKPRRSNNNKNDDSSGNSIIVPSGILSEN